MSVAGVDGVGSAPEVAPRLNAIRILVLAGKLSMRTRNITDVAPMAKVVVPLQLQVLRAPRSAQAAPHRPSCQMRWVQVG